VTKDEAVNLLNTVLNKNGYAAIRNDRTLTIVNKDEAKTHDIRVQLGNDPARLPRNDEVITQIIPVRFVEVAQLLKDLQPLVSLQTPMTANESGNSIIITDTQANIRRVMEVVKAIDDGAEDVTEVKVFRLHFADPVEMADLLTSLFPDETRSGGSSSPVQFGGGGGFRRFFGGFGGGGGLFGGGGGNNAGSSGGNNQRIKKRARVIAVADQRTGSVVVTAAKDLMAEIGGVVADLDAEKAKNTTVSVFQFKNADPQEVLPVLQDMFQKTGAQNTRGGANQNSTLMNRATQQSQTQNSTSSSRTGGSRTGGSGVGGGLP
jgi:type II secretory pathway component GspD/PulD (secretin)